MSMPLILKNNDAPGIITASFPRDPITTPTWHSSDDTIVSISSMTADGRRAIPILGRSGTAVVIVEAFDEFRHKMICSVEVWVRDGGRGDLGTISWIDNGPL